MVIVFGLDDRQPDAGFVRKNVISAFWFTTGREFAPNDHTAFGKIYLLANLVHQVPLVAGCQSGCNEFGANITLAEGFFIR